VPRPHRLALVCTAALVVTALAAPAAAQDAAFAEAESRNYARTLQAPTQQATDPAFLARWQEQSAANALEFAALGPVRALATTGNLCREWAQQCSGDPFRYPGATRSTTAPSWSR
jgi:hypothetical protein